MKALSIISPYGSLIAESIKTIEVRSWIPDSLPITDLVIVENKNRLSDKYFEEIGYAIAIIDIFKVDKWKENQIKPSCCEIFLKGYFAWEISNVRKLKNKIKVKAKRKIYELNNSEEKLLIREIMKENIAIYFKK